MVSNVERRIMLNAPTPITSRLDRGSATRHGRDAHIPSTWKNPITAPSPHAKFYISIDAEWPSVVFQTNAVLGSQEQVTWQWSIAWSPFSSQGLAQTNSAAWDAQPAIINLGGVLTVVASLAGGPSDSVSVHILGTQPETCDVTAYLLTCPNSFGFDKILLHETAMRHFDAAGNPVHSFDGGFGMAQLTNPVPSFAQVWNWKLNVDGALSLFAQKRVAAQAYLSRKGSYSESQLVHETVSRWNGGSYHVWDPPKGWIRKPAIFCDSQTANIGWNMTDAKNQGKTETELHARDSHCYARPPHPDDGWGYFGVCYADSILGV